MILTKTVLETELQAARQQNQQLLANLNVSAGIVAALEQMLKKLEQPEPAPAPAATDPAAPTGGSASAAPARPAAATPPEE
jgi:hypothetical protein